MSVKGLKNSGDKVSELTSFFRASQSFRNQHRDGYVADLAEYGVVKLSDMTDAQIKQFLLDGASQTVEQIATIRKLLVFKDRVMGGHNAGAVDAPTNDEV